MKYFKSLLLSAVSILTLSVNINVYAQPFVNLQPINTAQQVTLSDPGIIGNFEATNPRIVNMIQVNYNEPGNNAAVLIRSKNGLDYTFGSGMFVSPNVFVTAAHIFTNDDGSLAPAEAYTYTQGSNGAYQPNTFEPYGASYAFTSNQLNYYNRSGYKSSTPTDLVAVVVDTPMQLTYMGAEFNDLAESTLNLTTTRTIGYPASADGQNLILGALYQGSGNLLTNYNISGMGVTDSDSIEGVSGSGVLNAQNQVVGVHTNSFLFSGGNRPGFIRFNQNQIKWLKEIINNNKISGWKQYNGANYYFQDNGHLLKNTTTTIDGEEYTFDINGKATLKQEQINTTQTQTTSTSTTNSTSSNSISTTSTSSSSSSSTSSSSSSLAKPKTSTSASTSITKKSTNNKKPITKKKKQIQKNKTEITLILTTTCIICFLIGLGGTIYINKK